MTTVRLVLVGGGPRTVSLLERLAASLPELAPDLRLDIDVVDPHPAGGGRIWRREQSRLLWMNSVAEDITIFTDESVECDGPIRSGPSLSEWASGEGQAILRGAGWLAPGELFTPTAFAARGIQAEYLAWVWDSVLADLPASVRLHEHRERAVSVVDHADQQRVTLASGRQLDADVVVLAQGYLDHEPTPEQAGWLRESAARGLTYVPPGYTADLDLSGLRAGEPVIVRGMGLAFVDLFVLLGEGRGGTFTGSGTDLTYHPSGHEPVLYAGSRRGVPYHSKLGYKNVTDGPVRTRHLTAEALAGTEALDLDHHVLPLLARELTDLHYRRLFAAHPERTSGEWASVETLIAEHDVTTEAFAEAIARHVPDERDRFYLPRVDRPLEGQEWADRAAYEQDIVTYIEDDLARRATPEFSSDRAVFDGLLSVYAVLASAVSAGRLTPSERVRFLEEFHGLFSFLASGPPPRRLAELVALHRAGVVRFLGPAVRVSLTDNGFRAESPAVEGAVTARALVDARLPRPDVTATTDPLIKGLLRRGELRADTFVDPESGRERGGQLISDERCRAVRADGSSHENRYLLGPSVSGSVGSGGFSRPGFNGPGFRQNDAVARQLLDQLQQRQGAKDLRTTALSPTTTTTEAHRYAS